MIALFILALILVPASFYLGYLKGTKDTARAVEVRLGKFIDRVDSSNNGLIQ